MKEDVGLTNKIRRLISKFRKKLVYLVNSFGSSCECNICGWTGHHFRRHLYPNKPAPTYFCPRCGCLPRHRLALYLLKDSLKSGNKTLHVAPHPMIATALKAISDDYLAIDIDRPGVRKMDLTNLEFQNERFTLIWCSHVLEHIIEDKMAMSEIYRVLTLGGVAIIQVPIYGNKTYENSKINTPEERLKHFKQSDHVRLYGADIEERLQSVGFNVSVLDISLVPSQDAERYCLDYPSTREIFICEKPSN